MPIKVYVSAPTVAEVSALQGVSNGLAGVAAPPSGTVPALVAHVTNIGSSTGGTSAAIVTTGATSLIRAISCSVGATLTLTDSFNNTWLPLNAYSLSGSGDSEVQFYYAEGVVVGAGHTFTVTGPALSYASENIFAFKGIKAAAPFDIQNGASAAVGPLQPGAVTPSQVNSLIVSALSWYNTGGAAVASVDSGFTITDQNPVNASANFGNAAAYMIQGSPAAAVNPTWSLTSSGFVDVSAAIAVFKSGT